MREIKTIDEAIHLVVSSQNNDHSLFFGYGSLMYANGINGRGMQHRYTDEELSYLTVGGFNRSL